MTANGPSFPRTARALRAALEERGIRPSRGRGQCFLTDPQAVDAIVRDADVRPADRVVEVGTGPGVLTHALCEIGAEVITFDVDARIQALAVSLRAWPDRVRFHALDVLAGKHELAPRFAAAFDERPAPPGRLLLVSNLPYSVATPIVLGVLSLPQPPSALVVMLQEEVATKWLAPPGSRAYGAPSVHVQLAARGKILRRFGPQLFWPRPKVRSALVRLEPIDPQPLAGDEWRPFARFVTDLFSRRRKVFPTALQHAAPGLDATACEALTAEAGLARTARVQQLEPARLVAIWRHARDLCS